jgi:Leucine-rich repeat (LRR) protein
MVALLAKFRNLSELSLHGNKISSVPALDNIRHLRAIDLTNNPIKVSPPACRSISTSSIASTTPQD